jgi:hypothetical protein
VITREREDGALRLTKVLVAAFAAALAIMFLGVHALGSAPNAPSSRAAAAGADATGLLGLLVLPPGAVASSGPPPGTGWALSQPPNDPNTLNRVGRLEHWTVPGTPDGVLSFIAAHAPAGGSVDSTSNASQPGNLTSNGETFSFPSTALLDYRTLAVTAIAATPTSTAVLVSAEDVWATPRPAFERVPGDARIAIVSTIAPLGRRGGGRSSHPLVVTAPTKVAALIRAVNALPASQPGVYHCPLDDGRALSIAFRASARGRGRVLALVHAGLTVARP